MFARGQTFQPAHALADPVTNQPNDYCHQLMSTEERTRVQLLPGGQPWLRLQLRAVGWERSGALPPKGTGTQP